MRWHWSTMRSSAATWTGCAKPAGTTPTGRDSACPRCDKPARLRVENPEQEGLSTPMPNAENSITIDRPIDEVFAYLADGTNNPRWRRGVLEIHRTSQTGGQGATYRQVLKGPGGRRIDGDYRVTTHQPPHRLEFTVTAGPARPTGRFELAEAGPGRTNVTFALDLPATGPMRLMSGMIARQMRTEVDQLDRLKHDLERTGHDSLE